MPRQIGVRELRNKLDAGEQILLVDVRQPWEHERARLGDDLLIPLDELPQRLDEIARDAPIVCYCHHGVRSLSAAAILENAGFGEVASLAGGIDRWSMEIDPKVPRY
jgi:rhodanese-related sulfurtransferase